MGQTITATRRVKTPYREYEAARIAWMRALWAQVGAAQFQAAKEDVRGKTGPMEPLYRAMKEAEDRWIRQSPAQTS
jgi:hypothetical protein